MRSASARGRCGVAAAGWVCLAVVGALTVPAGAGLLAICDEAMPEWRGTVSTTHNYGDAVLSVDLDYAVFEPEDYPGADPSSPPEYVYAYQIFNKATSTVSVIGLSVGIQPGSGAKNIGQDTSGGTPGEPGDVLSDLMSIGSSAAHWGFGWLAGDEIPPGDHSYVLLFTSPNEPQMVSATLTDGGLPVPGGEIPSPVPAPAAPVLLGVGLLALLKRRGRFPAIRV